MGISVQEALLSLPLFVLLFVETKFLLDQSSVMMEIVLIQMAARAYVRLSLDTLVLILQCHQCVNRFVEMERTCQEKFVMMVIFLIHQIAYRIVQDL